MAKSLIFALCVLCITPVLAGEVPFLEANEAKQILSSRRSASHRSILDGSVADTKGPRQVPEIDDGWEEIFITYCDFEDTKDPSGIVTNELRHKDHMTNPVDSHMISPEYGHVISQVDSHVTSVIKSHTTCLFNLPLPTLLARRPDVILEPWPDTFIPEWP